MFEKFNLRPLAFPSFSHRNLFLKNGPSEKFNFGEQFEKTDEKFLNDPPLNLVLEGDISKPGSSVADSAKKLNVDLPKFKGYVFDEVDSAFEGIYDGLMFPKIATQTKKIRKEKKGSRKTGSKDFKDWMGVLNNNFGIACRYIEKGIKDLLIEYIGFYPNNLFDHLKTILTRNGSRNMINSQKAFRMSYNIDDKNDNTESKEIKRFMAILLMCFLLKPDYFLTFSEIGRANRENWFEKFQLRKEKIENYLNWNSTKTFDFEKHIVKKMSKEFDVLINTFKENHL